MKAMYLEHGEAEVAAVMGFISDGKRASATRSLL
jgi:hypothetical protein